MSEPTHLRSPVLDLHILALTVEEAVNEGIPLLKLKQRENPDHFVQVHMYLPQTAHKLLGLRDVEFYAVGGLVGVIYMLGLAKSRGGRLRVFDDGKVT